MAYGKKESKPWDCFYKAVAALKDEHEGVEEYTEMLKVATEMGEQELIAIITPALVDEKEHIARLTNWIKTRGVDLIS